MQKRNRKHRKKQILAGHKRVGKRFIPPMMQLPVNKDISYVKDMLPELIWIGLINEKIGYIRGARLIEKIFLAVDEVTVEGQEGNYALMSCFKKLSADQKNTIVNSIRSKGVLDVMQDSIAPLTLLYDECPLAFFGPPPNVYSQQKLVATIKWCVGKTIDKYDTPAIVLHGAMLLERLVTKTIKFSADMDLPNFNSVINSPGSKEAKRAAGFMRANGLAEFSMMKVGHAWAEHFWNKNIEISLCEFAENG